MEYTVVRSGRKTLCIQIGPRGEVIVRAPQRCPGDYIDAFVQSKASWIETHRAKRLETMEAQAAFRLQTGDTLSFCGRPLTVKIAPGCRVYLSQTTVYLPRGEVQSIQAPLLSAYKKAALPYLEKRLAHWAKVMRITYRQLKLSTAASRWGSCSRDGVIRISAYLLFAPEQAIDYVLIHELSHRKVFDHSPAFWAVVETYMPDWKHWRRVLRDLAQTLYAKGFHKY